MIKGLPTDPLELPLGSPGVLSLTGCPFGGPRPSPSPSSFLGPFPPFPIGILGPKQGIPFPCNQSVPWARRSQGVKASGPSWKIAMLGGWARHLESLDTWLGRGVLGCLLDGGNPGHWGFGGQFRDVRAGQQVGGCVLVKGWERGASLALYLGCGGVKGTESSCLGCTCGDQLQWARQGTHLSRSQGAMGLAPQSSLFYYVKVVGTELLGGGHEACPPLWLTISGPKVAQPTQGQGQKRLMQEG